MTRFHHGDLERALESAALELARVGGVAAVTLRAAARRVGVTHPAVYRHFANREAMLARVSAGVMRRLAALLRTAEGEEASPRQRCVRIVEAYVRWALDDPGSFRIAFCDELWDKDPYPDLRAASDEAAAPLMDAVRELDGGTLTTEGRCLAVALWATAHGAATLALDRQVRQGELSLEAGTRPDVLAGRSASALIAGWRPE